MIEKLVLETKCDGCGEIFDIPMVRHHVLTKFETKLLKDRYKEQSKQIEWLRRKLVVFICKDCENNIHCRV